MEDTLYRNSEQLVMVEIFDIRSKERAILSFFYGLHTIRDMKELRNKLLLLNITQFPWLVIGDFNTSFDYE